MALPSNEPLSKTGDLSLDTADPAISAGEATHPDPVTGEPGAHPVEVGVGALSAGAAGAAIGALAGPVGVVIGAAIGAFAGGLAGHEVAVSNDDRAVKAISETNFVEPTGSITDETGKPSSVMVAPAESLTVFPGSIVGAPVVSLENEGADTVADGISFKLDAGPAESVRSAAYYRYLERRAAGRDGDEMGDWLEAERELSQF